MCILNQLGKYRVKDMNAYIEFIIDKLLKLWVGMITMHDISISIGKNQFQFHGILTWIIHDALMLTHFCGM